MFSQRNAASLLLAIAMSAGAGIFLGSHAHVLAKEQKSRTMTNADYAREAQDYLKKAHEDVDHLINSDSDKKAKGYADAQEAKKAIDRADKAMGRYIGTEDGK